MKLLPCASHSDDPEPAAPVLFVNAAVLHPEQGIVKPGSWLRVEHGKVAATGKGRSPDGGAAVVDCAGGTIMPGLIDCHVVLTTQADAAPRPEIFLALQRMLAAGFTTVRVDGAAGCWLRDAVERGLVIGPRLLAAGEPIPLGRGRSDLLADAGMHNANRCSCCASTLGLSGAPPAVVRARQGVGIRIRARADHVSLDLGEGVRTAARDWTHSGLNAAAILAAIDEASSYGKLVVAVAHSAEEIRHAIKAGVRALIGGSALDEMAAADMARQRSFLVAVVGEACRASAAQGLHLARKAGVPIAFGTGTGWDQGIDAADALAARPRREAPIETIRSVTTIAARALRMEGLIGTLCPGASADLLIVEGDPTQDISLLGRRANAIVAVFKNGHRIAST